MFPHNFFPPVQFGGGQSFSAAETDIANLALQKLGAAFIADMDEDSREARAMKLCYHFVRDRELRANRWRFADVQAIVTKSAITPPFDRSYAFLVPVDCLRLYPPPRAVDWQIQRIATASYIATNDVSPLRITYTQRVGDPSVYDSLFIDMFACKLAQQTCEAITQSNQKKADILQEYKEAKADARRINAFEAPLMDEPEDEWITGRLVDSERNWLRYGG